VETKVLLIDGKPSNAINITEALKIYPADAVEKVEVITNPSARYDAEGGGGILNVKKGKQIWFKRNHCCYNRLSDNHGLNWNFKLQIRKF
jgi:outer membrane receptor for ferrienterochelin and colicin